MAYLSKDRARNQCSTSGTGALTLGDQISGSQSIKTLPTGTTGKFYFSKGSQWITFLGTFTTPDQLARTRIIDSSSGVATNVDFAVGAGEVGMGVSAEDLDVLNTIETTVTCAATIDLGGAYARFVVLSGTTGPVTTFSNMTNKERIVRHSGETITHHATTMILLGGVNYVTSANDVSCFKGDASGNVREIWRQYGNVGGAWPAYSPVLTPGSGAITTQVSVGSYMQEGKKVFGHSEVTITTLGTAGTSVTITLPVAPRFAGHIIGREAGVTGKVIFARMSAGSATTSGIADYNNSTMVPVVGAVYIFDFVYEAL